MNRPKTIIAMLIALAFAISISGLSFAQSDQTGRAGRSAPQTRGGIATVIGMDQPDNCLRIRSGPGSEYDIIGCAALGEQLNITGVWTSNNWAQTADYGWVYGSQIQTDLRPPASAYSRAERYVVEEDYPVVGYQEDYYYLPDYGYDTYWYGSVPLFVYGANVWRKYHPWWLRKHWNWNRHHKVWNRDPAFRQNLRARTGGVVTPRNFVRDPSRFRYSGVTQFNANRVRPGSQNAITSARAFSGTNTGSIRNFSNLNRIQTRTFSSPNTFRTGTLASPNISTRSFSRPNISTRSFSSPSLMGSVGARSFSTGRIGGGGASFRGGGGLGMGGGAQFGGGGGGRRR